MSILRVVITAALAVSVAGCYSDVGTSLSASIDFWKISKAAKKAHPGHRESEARRRYAEAQVMDILAGIKDPLRKQLLAAHFYVAFANFHQRAIPAYCARMKLDLSEFSDRFVRANAGAEDIVAEVFARHRVSREQRWERQKPYAMAAAKYELMAAAGRLSGSYNVCKMIRDKPNLFLNKARFDRLFPEIAVTLVSPTS